MKQFILNAIVLGTLSCVSLVPAAEEKKETTPMNDSKNEGAIIKTSEGIMVVQFWTDAAP